MREGCRGYMQNSTTGKFRLFSFIFLITSPLLSSPLAYIIVKT